MTVLKTLLDCLENNGKCKNDICWVGCSEFVVPTDIFFKVAEKTKDNFGGDIVYDILVVGKDFWIERDVTECGDEYWAYRAYPKKPLKSQKICSLSLRGLTEEEERKAKEDIRFGEDKNAYKRELWMTLYKE